MMLHDNDPRAALPALAVRWRNGEWQDAEFAALYFLIFQYAQHGARFASRARRDAGKPQADAWLNELLNLPRPAPRLFEIFERYHFLHVIPNVNQSFLHWLRGDWAIRLLDTIPTPAQVLELQCAGIRPATVVLPYPRMCEAVLTKRDGLHFLTHDLEHAYKFFHDPAGHALQRRLFQTLHYLLSSQRFRHYLHELEFSLKFDYLISDMNTHPAHGIHYLRAILVEHHLRVLGRGPRDQLPDDARDEINAVLGALITGCGLRWEDVLPLERCA